IGRAENAPDVDADVALKVFILDGNDGIAQHGRKIFIVRDDAALQREAADDVTLIVIDLSDGVGTITLQLRYLRQVGRVNQEQSRDRSEGGRGQHQQHEHNPAYQLLSCKADRG